MSRRNVYGIDMGDALIALGIAELALAIIGIIATIIGYAADMIVLTIFGGTCLACFVVAAIVVGFLSLNSWRREKNEDSGDGTR